MRLYLVSNRQLVLKKDGPVVTELYGVFAAQQRVFPHHA